MTSNRTSEGPRSEPAGESIVDWYATAARDLPWRRPGVSAWAVLVSEVMLQQTPVARVLPAYGVVGAVADAGRLAAV